MCASVVFIICWCIFYFLKWTWRVIDAAEDALDRATRESMEDDSDWAFPRSFFVKHPKREDPFLDDDEGYIGMELTRIDKETGETIHARVLLLTSYDMKNWLAWYVEGKHFIVMTVGGLDGYEDSTGTEEKDAGQE
jgi:hypothetical protein